jgi:hypothetical protein
MKQPGNCDISGLYAATIRLRMHRARLELRKTFECGLETPASQAHYDAQMCQDLIEAKQVVFDSLDLTQDIGTSILHSPLPIDTAVRITTASKLIKDS